MVTIGFRRCATELQVFTKITMTSSWEETLKLILNLWSFSRLERFQHWSTAVRAFAICVKSDFALRMMRIWVTNMLKSILPDHRQKPIKSDFGLPARRKINVGAWRVWCYASIRKMVPILIKDPKFTRTFINKNSRGSWKKLGRSMRIRLFEATLIAQNVGRRTRNQANVSRGLLRPKCKKARLWEKKFSGQKVCYKNFWG